MEHRRTSRKIPLLVASAIALALVASAGVTAAVYFGVGKDVVVSVDGKEHEVTTRAQTVGDVLEDENITVGKRDVVAPKPATSLEDGSRVAVRYARMLHLTVDGKDRSRWVTASNVNEALDQLGVRYEGAELSASRSAGIDRDGMKLQVHTLKRVTVDAGKQKKKPVATTGLTVKQALKDADVDVDHNDQVQPAPTKEVSSGDAIKVTRVKVVKNREKVDIPHETVKEYDDSKYTDQEETTKQGKDGEKARVVRTTFHNGKQVDSEVVDEKVLSKPVDEVVTVGTKERSEDDSEDDSDDGGGGGDGLNWDALAECESGGDPTAVSPNGQYHGLYQFSVETWEAMGGSGLPSEAPADEQTMRAQKLYEESGDGQWPVCGEKLYS